MLDKDNKSRGMATVTYENQVQAANAICETILLSNNVCVQNPTFGRRHLGARHLCADIWARGHLGAKTFGRKTFGREMRSSALPTIIFYFQKNFFTKILYFQRC